MSRAVPADRAAAWLSVAVLLERRAAGDGPSDNEVRSALEEALGNDTAPNRSDGGLPLDGDDLASASRRLANEAEEAEAFHVALSILGAVERIYSDSPLERGRSIAQRARIARKVNELDHALELYHTVEQLGRQARSPELRARAHLGYGVLAHVRGNLPEARQRFASAAAIADAQDVPDVSSMAHHGLMIIVAKAGDLERSLHEGWLAFHHAGASPDRQAEMLNNVGQLLLEMQHARPALHALAGAAMRTKLSRLRLPICGGLAIAAAAVGEVHLVDYAERTIGALATEALLPYEVATAYLDLARANYQLARVEVAEAHRQRALDIAGEHGFHEFVHHAELLRPVPTPKPAARALLGAEGLSVVERLERLARPEALVLHG